MIRIWGSILAIMTFIDKDNQSATISKFAAAFDPSQGFFNGVIFVFGSAEVRDAIKKCFVQFFRKKKGGHESTMDPTCNGVTTNAEDSRGSFLLHRASQEDYSTQLHEDAPMNVPLLESQTTTE